MSKNSSISNNSDKHVDQMQVRFNCQKHFYFKLFSLVKQLNLA